ncbi:MAG TPA: hypothetical protein PLY93_15775, partial [Turneriella sp.]|nr:hypothetical protein [Turneriella sp.]
ARYYVGDLLHDHADELWPIISDERTIIYMCGLKGMEEGVSRAINAMAQKHGKGENYYATLDHRMEDEVY